MVRFRLSRLETNNIMVDKRPKGDHRFTRDN